MPTLTVSLLGEPRLRGVDGPVVCAAKKSLGLFCYLTLSGTRHSRRELAQLFWGGINPEAARASLRTALLRLPAPMAEQLIADRETLATAPTIELDTTRFTALAASDEIADLTEAAALYGGELLRGLEIDATAEFDDWLARERGRWRQAAQALFDRLIERHRERARLDTARAGAEREAAMATARRWCELEPAAEAAHRWLIRLYIDAGRTDAALAQYETCRRELAVAAGRGPSAQTRALVDALAATTDSATSATVAGDAMPADDAAIVVPGLPGTPFFGRVEELAALEQLLFEPDCRLLTLQALGGTGKTRLASVLVNQVASRYAQGAAWVALEAIASAAQVPLAIAQALRIDLPPQVEPAQALCAALSGQQRLLVLDNFEHLLVPPASRDGDAVEFVLALLRAAPRVRLLVTSREVLGVQEEWIYELRGLPYPSPDAAAPAAGSFAATELFAQRARQAYTGFSVQAEWPHIVRLCHLVDGMPLALELAAAWVRTLPCGDLVAAIETEIKALASRHRNRPERHRTLDAVVRTSWNLLAREQQRALAPLAVFVGGFTQEAAAAVADAPLRLLSALVDKSLVQRRADGRLGLHELVRQFARERLKELEAHRGAERRHATFFAALLERCRAQLDGANGTEATDTLTRELPNLMAAAEHWRVDVDGASIVEAWLRVLSGRSLHAQVRVFADRMLTPDVALTSSVRAMALIYRAAAHTFFDDGAASDADLAAAIAIAREHGLREALAAALVQSVVVGFIRDDAALIEQRLAEVQPLLPSVTDIGVRVRASYYAGHLLEVKGRITEATQHMRQTLALARELRASEQLVVTVQSALGVVLVRTGALEEAEATLRSAIDYFDRVGQRGYQARSLNSLAVALLAQPQRVESAAKAASRALALFEQLGHSPGISSTADTLGQAYQAMGRIDDARAQFVRAAATDSPILANEARFHLGLLQLAHGSLRAAVQIALESIAVALRHELGTVRLSTALLAVTIALSVDRASAVALRCLRRVLADGDLDADLRRHATRLLAQSAAATADDTAAAGTLSIDDLVAMRELLSRLV
jgi:predicted ATPase/DNA-binding SARP family transcriptional activator